MLCNFDADSALASCAIRHLIQRCYIGRLFLFFSCLTEIAVQFGNECSQLLVGGSIFNCKMTAAIKLYRYWLTFMNCICDSSPSVVKILLNFENRVR